MGVTVTEIALLIISAVVFVISFLIPESREKESGVNEEAAQAEIKDMIRQEVDAIRGHVEEVVEESMTYAMEKTERSLERLSNEKIMAVNEYSDTVMKEIHKSHEEVMFLYDMLNNKHENLKRTVTEASKAAKVMQDTVESIQTLRTPVEDSSGTPKKANTPRKQQKEAPQKETVKGEPLLRDVIAQRSTAAQKERITEKIAEDRETPSVMADETVEVQPDADATRNKNEMILELHKKGKSNVAIAKELGLGVGEVKLVIDLYKNM